VDLAYRTVFHSFEDFEDAWHRRPSGFRLFDLDRLRPEVLYEAANFLAGALLREGFHLFQNGGLPLLVRRTGNLVEEIVLRPASRASRRGLPFIPVCIQLHLSHKGLPVIRKRYWKHGSGPPMIVASGDVGELDVPPCFVIWHVRPDRRSFVPMVEWTERLTLPWFNEFHRPIELHARLMEGFVPLVRPDTTLEFMLAHYGPVEASTYLERTLDNHPLLAEKVYEYVRELRGRRVPIGISDNLAHNLAAIAIGFDLIDFDFATRNWG
jgi:hypothetical protein